MLHEFPGVIFKSVHLVVTEVEGTEGLEPVQPPLINNTNTIPVQVSAIQSEREKKNMNISVVLISVHKYTLLLRT